MQPTIDVTRRQHSTVYFAADLGMRTAEVVEGCECWEIRCYYGPDDYDDTIHMRPLREAAERVALAHSLEMMR